MRNVERFPGEMGKKCGCLLEGASLMPLPLEQPPHGWHVGAAATSPPAQDGAGGSGRQGTEPRDS